MAELDAERMDPELERYFAGYQSLMPHRVQEVLLVSSLYESFILEEDGLVADLISSEYLELNLSHAPRVTHVPTGDEALRLIRQQPVDLIITMTRLGGWNVAAFAEQVKKIKPDLPLVVLAEEPRELSRYADLRVRGLVNAAFVWNGDAKILLTIIKLLEDRLNVEHDIKVGNVRVIILIENSVRFYSAYLPLIYTEVMKLTQSLMAEGLNHTHRLLRQRARPKILLAQTFEEAWELYSKYSENVLGVISDVRFPRSGNLDPGAGIEFTRRVRADSPHLPVLLQSSDESHAGDAETLNACFLHKKSPTLLRDLRNFMFGNLGFGDFVFKLPDNTVVGRAHDLRSFAETIAKVPTECLGFHAGQNHFSNWLMARTEFEIATRIRPRQVSEFSTLEEVRRYLLESLSEYREKHRTGMIADFAPGAFDPAATFTRIGGGSLGGKARGLAFISALLRRYDLRRRFKNVRIGVPHSAVIGTDFFNSFLDENNLRGLAADNVDDEQIAKAFLAAELPRELHDYLSEFLWYVRYPLAVRSSSLLEDSQEQPFAGIYATHFIPNNHQALDVRLGQLCAAIKLVYASTFFRRAKRYLEATGHHTEEENMGVILQEIVGSRYDNRFYPTFSGVVRSYNFYPLAHMTPEDGVAHVALGLGKMVVEGGESLMFSPAHPPVLPQFAAAPDMLANSQRSFYALDMSRSELLPSADGSSHLARLGLDVAEADGTLAPIGSVYSVQDDVVYDGIYRPGPRLVSFAHVLKADLFPLAEILRVLLDIGRRGMACPIEIEFAVNMSAEPMEFGFLQIRPIVGGEEFEDVLLEEQDRARAVCYSRQAMGNGRVRNLQDIIYVRPDRFDSACTREIAAEISQLNDKLQNAGRPCVLIGPGRWGSTDRWLGIPITWDQVSSAKVIVETTLRDFMPAPSQGTHLFQNLTSSRVRYLTINPIAGEGFIDWNWLAARQTVEETRFVRHVVVPAGLEVKLDGRTRQGVILKPDGDEP